MALQKEIRKRISPGGLSKAKETIVKAVGASAAGMKDTPIDVEEHLPKLRGRSMDSAARPTKKGTSSRGTSVDLSFMSQAESNSDDSDKSTSIKRKSTSFEDGMLNNEGKTASSKKVACEKKKDSYAAKAKLPKKYLQSQGWHLQKHLRRGVQAAFRDVCNIAVL